MWRTLLSKSVKELRFVLKQTPEHYGAWSFVKKSLPEIRQLNQNTFFSVTELNDGFETPSAMHVIYGDGACWFLFLFSCSPIKGS